MVSGHIFNYSIGSYTATSLACRFRRGTFGVSSREGWELDVLVLMKHVELGCFQVLRFFSRWPDIGVSMLQSKPSLWFCVS